jgi:hypothetical protein
MMSNINDISQKKRKWKKVERRKNNFARVRGTFFITHIHAVCVTIYCTALYYMKVPYVLLLLDDRI